MDRVEFKFIHQGVMGYETKENESKTFETPFYKDSAKGSQEEFQKPDAWRYSNVISEGE